MPARSVYGAATVGAVAQGRGPADIGTPSELPTGGAPGICPAVSERPVLTRPGGLRRVGRTRPLAPDWVARDRREKSERAGQGYPAARRDGRRPASLVTRRSVWRRVGGEVGAGPRTGPQRAASGQRQGNALGPRRLGSPCPDEFVRRAWGRSRGAKGSAAASQLERLGGPRAAGCPREGEGSRTAKRGALTKTALQPQRRGNEHRRLKSALPPEGHEHRQCTEGLALSPASSDGREAVLLHAPAAAHIGSGI